MHPLFNQRRLLIATQHGKEQVLAPVLEAGLGVCCEVATNFDTDAFGTFSLERARPGDALNTARLKAEAAKRLFPDATLILTSEGSFGPSPQLPWAAADTELLYLWDTENQGVWTAQFHTLETNYVSPVKCPSSEKLLEMIEAWGFPSHGVILRVILQAGETVSKTYKGIQDPEQLKQLLKQYSQEKSISLFPDMRACFNPTRMRAIAACAEQLVRQLSVLCPKCSWPGFQLVKTLDGLLCESCGLPTRVPATALWQCQQCQFQEKSPVNHERRTTTSPRDCEFCNP